MSLPVTMTVVGLEVVAPLATVGARRQWADVAAPQTGTEHAAVRGRPLGAMVTTAGGDLAGATRREALRARVNRLIKSPPGAYAHLRDWGLRARRGELARPSTLARLQLQAERMLREDPDIRDARVTITNGPVRRGFVFRVIIQTWEGDTDDFLTSTGEGA